MVWGQVVAPVAAGDGRSDGTPRPAPAVGAASVALVVFTVYQFCNVDHFLFDGTPFYPLLSSLDAVVRWFFVLVAFRVLTPTFGALVDGSPDPHAQGFLRRQAVRLLPAYYVVVVTVWTARQSSLPGDWRDLVEHLTFTQVFDSKRIFYTVGPAWAVSVLVMFFVLVAAARPLLRAAVARHPSRRARCVLLAALAAGLGTVSVAWKLYALLLGGRDPAGSFATWFGPVATLDAFAAGAGVAVLRVALGPDRELRTAARVLLATCGAAALAGAVATRPAGGAAEALFGTACAVAFGLLLAAAVTGPVRRTGPRGPAGARRVLGGLGVVAYGTYLWHEPVLLLLHDRTGLVRQAPGAFAGDLVVVLAASLLAGWLSHVLVERAVIRLHSSARPARAPA